MDYRKINSHIILLLIVSIVGLTIAMVGRLIVLEKEIDTGTANLTFVIILGVCVIAYLIILATLSHVIVPWIMKKLPNKKRTAIIITDDNVLNEEKRIQKPSIEDIRKDAEKRHIEKQNEKINLFIEYSHLAMAPYVTDDELYRLDSCIELYARGELSVFQRRGPVTLGGTIGNCALSDMGIKLYQLMNLEEIEEADYCKTLTEFQEMLPNR